MSHEPCLAGRALYLWRKRRVPEILFWPRMETTVMLVVLPIIAAGAVVTQGKEFPPGSVIAGVPARVVREATDDDLLHIRGNAASYTDRLPAARAVRRV